MQSDGNQAFSFSVEFPGVKSLLGLHEHAATVSLLHTADLSKDPYRFKNIDHGSYEMNSTLALYSTVPLIYGFGWVNRCQILYLFINLELKYLHLDPKNLLEYFSTTPPKCGWT